MAIINSHWPLASTLALLFCLHLVSYGALATGDFADFVTEPVTTAATVDETNRATGTPYLTEYVIKGSRDGEVIKHFLKSEVFL